MSFIIPRFVHKTIEREGSKTVRAGLVSTTYEIIEYKIKNFYVLVQDPNLLELDSLTSGNTVTLRQLPWTSYCRWHSGPLDKPDNPLERLYCNTPAEGFCRQHRRSDRALYEMCLTINGERGLAACKAIDMRIKSEYVVYLTDFGGSRPKIGVTRRFRYVERIAEQPHIVATVLLITDSIYKARKTEINVSKMGLAQQTRKRSLRSLSRSLGESVARLSFWTEKISRKIGVDWNGLIFRVRPPDISGTTEIVDPSYLSDTLTFEGYWGGYLIIRAAGRRYLLKFRRIQHKDSIELPG